MNLGKKRKAAIRAEFHRLGAYLDRPFCTNPSKKHEADIAFGKRRFNQLLNDVEYAFNDDASVYLLGKFLQYLEDNMPKKQLILSTKEHVKAMCKYNKIPLDLDPEVTYLYTWNHMRWGLPPKKYYEE